MYIKQIKIKNYKSFLSTQEVIFTSGFNIVIGQNNAGKTALVEALSLQFDDKPHRSAETIPTYGGSPPPASNVECTFCIPESEFKILAWEYAKNFYVQKGESGNDEIATRNAINGFTSLEFHIKSVYQSKTIISSRIIEIDTQDEKVQDLVIGLRLNEPDQLPIVNSTNVIPNNRNDQLAAFILARQLIARIYHFRAERFNVGQNQIGNDPVLKPDAENLAQVLNLLQTSNPTRFSRLVSMVKTIFPDVKDITIPPISGDNNVKVLLWPIESSTERSDLALPLQESGTAIGQVLAVLYVAINSDSPRPIIIDEPQSFLHPTAIRKLFDILHYEFSKHQYIITTHSPLVVSAAKPDTITLLKKSQSNTMVQTVNPSEKDELRLLLSEVGARFSDVFGAENIIWVEGATEENTFPLIVSKILKKQLLGTEILGIINVGDLEGKHKDVILRIYKKLSEGQTLLPPALGFIYDREGRTEDEQIDLARESNGLIRFLQRRMYENYLINPNAIASIVSKLENFSDKEITANDLEKWIEENRENPKYFKGTSSQDPDNWIAYIHGAIFLNDLFKAFSENRYSYDKVRDGIRLTSWIIDNNPEGLKEISDLLASILDSKD